MNLPIDYSFKYVTRYDRCTTVTWASTASASTRKRCDLSEQPDKNLIPRFNIAEKIIRNARGRRRPARSKALRPKKN